MRESTTFGQDRKTDEFRWNLLQKKALEMKVGKGVSLFREDGIEPILIKGVAAGRYYPDSIPRLSIDMDLAVPSRQFRDASRLAESAGPQGLAIDVHDELRHLDTVDWEDLFDNSRLIDVAGVEVRVLRPEDHLRVLCVHWLTDGGRDRERLWDIYYLVNNRDANFDWSRFLDIVSAKRRRWLVCAVAIAHRYLDLDLTGTPIEDEVRNLPQWITETVENEWSEDRFLPMEASIFKISTLPGQIRRRLRPNPIWATVQMEGSFDARTRAFYQIGSFLSRIPASVRRVAESLTQRVK